MKQAREAHREVVPDSNLDIGLYFCNINRHFSEYNSSKVQQATEWYSSESHK
jgi:hypothetical protein